MSSNINAAIPPLGSATTAGVRANFAAAKAEIEELQGRTGFVDYNDAATGVTPLSVSANTWTKLTNDTAGPFTKTDALPAGVTSLWSALNNQLNLAQLPVNSIVTVRADLIVTTSTANQVVKTDIRAGIGTASEFTLENSALQSKAAGAHKVVVSWDFYIGSNNVKNAPAEIRLWSDASATVRVNGWYIKATKAIA